MMNKEKKTDFTDKKLLEKFHETGDNQWLGILLQQYTLLLFGVCMKYLKDEEKAKDAVQQIFFKAIAELKKYKIEYFKSWLYMVARNYCLMQFRDRYGKINTGLNENITEENFLLNEKKEKEEWLNAMESSLDELNDEQKNCVILFYLQKKSYNEICAATGFSAMQVKSNIQNGKRNLKVLIEKKMKQRK
jgi:RNA polymerase sigma factor (sigma-70 family)